MSNYEYGFVKELLRDVEGDFERIDDLYDDPSDEYTDEDLLDEMRYVDKRQVAISAYNQAVHRGVDTDLLDKMFADYIDYLY